MTLFKSSTFCFLLLCCQSLLALDSKETSILSLVESIPAKTIYLFRHAEKAKDGTRNPDLNQLGLNRAENLKQWLADKNISTIYSTNYKRTLQTVSPLAEALEMNIVLYDPRDLKKFAAQLLQSRGNSVVVGHSNTTPDLVTYLGGNAEGEIDELEYDRLYQIDYSADKTKKVQSQLLRQK
jgi:phosphohistidine phosphatase SixA